MKPRLIIQLFSHYKFLVVGGTDEAGNIIESMEYYDSNTRTFTHALPPVPLTDAAAHNRPCLSAFPNHFFLAGGIEPNGMPSNRTYTIDTNDGLLIRRDDMPFPRGNPTCLTVQNVNNGFEVVLSGSIFTSMVYIYS